MPSEGAEAPLWEQPLLLDARKSPSQSDALLHPLETFAVMDKVVQQEISALFVWSVIIP